MLAILESTVAEDKEGWVKNQTKATLFVDDTTTRNMSKETMAILKGELERAGMSINMKKVGSMYIIMD